MRNSFALVTEGPTDQEVITNILCGFYEDKDLDPSLLQPSRALNVKDQTPGGWGNMIDYLASQKFRDSFAANEFVIIHFDADVCDDTNFGVSKSDEMIVVIENIVKKLLESIGEDFYESAGSRIIFAICIDSIECWFLPLYFETNKSKRNKQLGCISTLNPELMKKHKFYINEKELSYYRTISKAFQKKRDLIRCAELNDSLRHFLESLPSAEELPQQED